MGYGFNPIDLTENCVLTDFCKSKTADKLHGTYNSFDLNNLSDDERRVNFRFKSPVWVLKSMFEFYLKILPVNSL